MFKQGIKLMGLAATFCGIFAALMGVFYGIFMSILFVATKLAGI